MITKTIKVRKGLPVQISAKGRYYWDFSEVKKFETSGTYTLDMRPYDGFCYTSRAAFIGPTVLNFEGTILPDGSKAPEVSQCLMDSATTYEGIVFQQEDPNTQIVNCTVTNDNIASGFSISSGIKILKPFPETISQLKVLFKLTVPSNTESYLNEFLTVNDSGVYKGFGISNSAYFCAQTAQNKALYGTTLSKMVKGDTYWIKIEKTDSGYAGFHKKDQDYSLETVENEGEWIDDWVSSLEFFAGYTYNVGYCENSSKQYYRGSLDLNNCAIWCNDELFWQHLIVLEKCPQMQGCLFGCTDTGEAGTFDCFYDEKTQRFLLSKDSAVPDARYVGEVVLEAHDVLNYADGVWSAL